MARRATLLGAAARPPRRGGHVCGPGGCARSRTVRSHLVVLGGATHHRGVRRGGDRSRARAGVCWGGEGEVRGGSTPPGPPASPPPPAPWHDSPGAAAPCGARRGSTGGGATSAGGRRPPGERAPVTAPSPGADGCRVTRGGGAPRGAAVVGGRESSGGTLPPRPGGGVEPAAFLRSCVPTPPSAVDTAETRGRGGRYRAGGGVSHSFDVGWKATGARA